MPKHSAYGTSWGQWLVTTPDPYVVVWTHHKRFQRYYVFLGIVEEIGS